MQMVNMGNRIKALRLEKYITQTEMARRIGVSKAMISSYELEQRSPSYEVLIKIAAFFNVSTDFLLGVDKSSSIKFDGLNDREIRAVMNIIEVIREK
jgi:transcriptional regulator with XRE-family HTH domain